MPRVSVIIPTVGRARFLRDAIRSALSQGIEDIEILVVDATQDGQTERALDGLDGPIRLLAQNGTGRSDARNEGVEAARAPLVAFLDDDDVWQADKLVNQLAILDRQPDVALVHARVMVVDEQLRPLREWSRRTDRAFDQAQREGYTYAALASRCTLFLSTVVVRRPLLLKAGLFDPAFDAYEDWDLYLRLARLTRFHLVDTPLVLHRVHSGNTTNEALARGRVQLMTKHVPVARTVVRRGERRRALFALHSSGALGHWMLGHTHAYRDTAKRAFRLSPLAFLRSRHAIRFMLCALPGRA